MSRPDTTMMLSNIQVLRYNFVHISQTSSEAYYETRFDMPLVYIRLSPHAIFIAENCFQVSINSTHQCCIRRKTHYGNTGMHRVVEVGNFIGALTFRNT